MKLDGKLCVVTGGAMGNGLGIVKVFIKYGATVAVLDYDDKVNDLTSEFGDKVIPYKVDIRDSVKVSECIKDLMNNHTQIDVLVNNAGVCKLDTFENMTDEVRDFHFDINIKGTWNVTKACLPYMKNINASIVNLSSVTGPKVADPGEVAYATTKGAVLAFTKGCAAEFVQYKIRVNAIMPGYIHTPMVDSIAKETNSENPHEVIDGITKGIPMGRMGTIEELGELAAFLASSESSYITGQGIVIDGASTLPETMVVGS